MARKIRENDLGDLVGVLRIGTQVPILASTGLGLASQVRAGSGSAAAAQAALPGAVLTGGVGIVGLGVTGAAFDVAERSIKKKRR